ncbi:MAG: hypothetical protein JGK17_29355 [Microcoleus sp. PH2017_10_PVI_O_A]|uniref:hypothetical protein n=1 Tax=unclassified Microcoleus TaxID=2642155 RepID=UPI001D88089C|nr:MULTISPECIES: hypothetical protein [unclassified Microcoleus]MCC3409588.1 hypothetical protein [Microcoleus sp. PH2017_10_PVI_O_A]MCC3463838.1 hypothetical protein [Microcoleus sp. PH2017_11_PCY_U_A]MCC3482189.1 hypothetical protein [Microcoleus sp. PH2017_12_PCY_D_A]MCC3531814.1 hypothetical protein [Microcoleus sp. PH2017_21_RUC_O_A]MCC3544141.1 hypothetical protein [Microcoleus sp. PH2017_22_RUC_O_B]
MLPISDQLKNQDASYSILLVNSQRQISGLTPSLLKIWNIPELIIRSLSEHLALQFVAEQFDNPQVFLKNMTEIYEQTQLEVHEKAQLRDGRTIERHSKPLWVEGEYAGRLWIFKINTEIK